ncbi:MAG: signal peptidase II [Spirochaetes bacterium]|jgi:signal peptidase II|nr:signal peptidase II [Spirochaetota bacterium]
MKRNKAVIITFVTIFVNLFFDRITKLLAIAFLKDEGAYSFLNNMFVLKYAENSGAFLSMGTNWPVAAKYLLLLGLPVLVCAVAIAYCILRETDKIRLIIIATIIAGGFGNIYDRFVYDFYVVDFMNFGIGTLRTGILNVADLSITFGAIAFILYEYRTLFPQSVKSSVSDVSEEPTDE